MKKDIVVIGAGASGIGIGILLEKYFPQSYMIVEKGPTVGISFLNWTKETRFISPSFVSEDFGIFDLNAVTNSIKDSPGLYIGKERYSGKEYQKYLEEQYKNNNLKIRFQTEIIECSKMNGVFFLKTASGETIEAKNIVYAGGEYSFPFIPDIPGKEYVTHNKDIDSYTDISEKEVLIVGGYESGIDVAYNFIKQGKKVVLLEKGQLSLTDRDPSLSLSLHSQSRLAEIENNPNFLIQQDFQVTEVVRKDESYALCSSKGKMVTTTGRIIFATGFDFSQSVFGSMFAYSHGDIQLTSTAESTKEPGVYLLGPMTKINGLLFCFIYKYRLLFPVVAYALAKKLGYKTKLFSSEQAVMDMEKFCDEACGCC